MASRFTKYGVAILAAVLMLTAFAGAASAGGSGTVDDPYDADGWNGLGKTPKFEKLGTIYIVDSDPTHILNPKTSATISASSVTLDFSGFKGTFAGIPTATSGDNKGALFGSLSLGANTLEIKGLNMTSVTVTSTGNTVGGIIGLVSGTGTLDLTNCHLKDCTVKSTGGKEVGGLVGQSQSAVTMDDCSVDNCKITGGASGDYSDVGGLIGWPRSSATISNCTVSNCTSIEGTKGGVGGLVGYAGGKLTTTDCSVVNCKSISGGGKWIGGLAGAVTSDSDITRCKVLDCTVKSTQSGSDEAKDAGGLVGQAYQSSVKFTGCTVANSTIAAPYGAGGLLGSSDRAVIMDDCSVDNCTITGDKKVDNKYSKVGGLIGSHTSSATISNCTVSNCPSIKGTVGGCVGGLVGYAIGKLTTTDCSVVNCPSITGAGNWIGGLAGAIHYTADDGSEVTRCKVLDCKVESTEGYDVGGLVGQAYQSKVKFTGCTVANSTITSAKKYDVGGLLGFSDRAVTMDDCSVDNCKITGGKDSSSGNSDVGGLIGRHTTFATIRNCTVSNCPSITGTGSCVGGLIGYSDGVVDMGSCSVDNCKITGDKKSDGSSMVGGLIGRHTSSATIRNCTVSNCPLITGTGSWIGGLVGNSETTVTVTLDNCLVENCTIESGYDVPSYTGGLIGYAKGEGGKLTTTDCSVVNCSIKDTGGCIGGLVGVSYMEMEVTRCKVLDCKVESTGGYNVGGLVGQIRGSTLKFTSCTVANSTIESATQYSVGGLLGSSDQMVTMDNCSVDNCTINGKYQVGGLVGRSQQPVTLNNCSIDNCKIGSNDSGGSSYLGGLIGNIEATSVWAYVFTDCSVVNCSIEGTGNYIGGFVGQSSYYSTGNTNSITATCCKVLHCDVVSSGGWGIGGMIGATRYSLPSFMDCTVANSTIASAQYGAGGLIGYSLKAVFMDTCSIENCAITAIGEDSGYSSAGGLVGTAKVSISSENCAVKNCVIAATNYGAGGLVGSVGETIEKLQGCSVMNCTIAGSDFAGGLVGYTNSASGCSGNSVKYSAVNGIGSNVRLDCGNGKDLSCTANLNENFIHNNTDSYDDTITLRDKNGATCSVDANFWKTIFDTYADPNTRTPAPAAAVVTHLGEYGKVGGYGYRSMPKYTVTYDGNDATSGTAPIDCNSPYASPYTIDVTVTVLGNTGNLAKTGHTFGGWNTKNDGTGTAYVQGSTFTIKADTTLYAKWNSKEYAVNFFMNGHGTQVENTTVSHGSRVTEPPAPSQEGFTFNGWYKDTGLSTKYDFTTPVTANLNLYANWTVNSHMVNIDTVSNGQVNAVPKGSVEEGTTVTLSNVSNPGYHFSRYDIYKTGEKSMKVDNSSNQFTMPGFSVNVSGIFAANVTHVGFNNGMGTQTIDNTFGTSTKMPATPTKEGFTFNGWNVSLGSGQWADFNSSSYNDNGVWKYTGSDKGNLDVHANWTKISTYTITTDTVNGTVTASKDEAAAGDKIHVDAVNDAGYHFVDWNVTNSAGKITVDSATPHGNFTMPASDVNAGANFAANVTHVGFNNGMGTQTIDNTFGTSTKMPATPTKEGFTFNGWNVSLGSGQWAAFNSSSYNDNGIWKYTGADKGTLDVHANWTVNSHMVSIDTVSNGQVNAVPKGSVEEGTTVTLSNASNPGYHFARYDIYKTGEKSVKVDNSSNQFTMPGFSVNVSGIFAANVTHVGFNNGTGTQTIDNTFGTSTQMPATPTKEGFMFAGWNVSLGSGQWAAFNSSSYNDNGIWKYIGADKGTLDVHANWTKISTYTITTDTVNGTVTASKDEAAAGDKIHVDAVNDAGYHFVDWNVTNSAGKITVDSPTPHGNFTMPASDVNAGANFAANVTHVGFNNGTGTQTIDNTFGTSTKMPATPTKEGFTFNGWNVSLGSGQWATFNSSSYNDNGVWKYTGADKGTLDVHANWTVSPAPKTYTVTIEQVIGGEGTADRTSGLKAGDTVKLTATSNTGYRFGSWNSTDTANFTNSTKNPYTFAMKASSLTITPVFVANTTAITLDANGGTAGTSHVNATYNSNILDPATIVNPTKQGSDFNGWYTQSSGGVEVINTDGALNSDVAGYTDADGKWTNPSSTLTLYANWTVGPAPTTYTVTVTKAVGGSGSANKTSGLKAGDTVKLTATSNTGYRFGSWNSTDTVNFTNSTKNPYEFTMKASSLTITPVFVANTTEITLDANGGTGGTSLVNATYNSNILDPATIVNPTKQGSDFNGWYTQSSGGIEVINTDGTLNSGVAGYTDADGKWTNPSSTLTLYANWNAGPAPTTYKVTVITDKGRGSAAASPATGEKGMQGTLTATPEFGYEFSEWSVLEGNLSIASPSSASTSFTFGNEDALVKARFNPILTPTGTISGTITWTSGEDGMSAVVKLLPTSQNVAVEQTGTSDTYQFTDVPAGVYNIEITYTFNDGNVRTANLVVDTTRPPYSVTGADITLPEKKVDAKVIVADKEKTPEVVVDGVVDEAKSQAVEYTEATSVTVTLVVKDDSKAKAIIAEIKRQMPTASDNIQPLNATVLLTIDAGKPTVVSTTNTVLELYVPFNKENKYDICVFGTHDNNTTKLTEVDERPQPDNRVKGTYFIGEDGIYIYAQDFSDYTVAFSETVTFTVTVATDGHGTVDRASISSVPSGSTVAVSGNTFTVAGTTVTATPDTGYEFDNWDIDAGEHITSDTTITASFKEVGSSNRGHSASIPKDYTPSSYVPPMVQETAKPTTAPTLAAPTMMPMTKPTQTQKSPAPFVGLIAGLGAAALLIRMRK